MNEHVVQVQKKLKQALQELPQIKNDISLNLSTFYRFILLFFAYFPSRGSNAIGAILSRLDPLTESLKHGSVCLVTTQQENKPGNFSDNLLYILQDYPASQIIAKQVVYRSTNNKQIQAKNLKVNGNKSVCRKKQLLFILEMKFNCLQQQWWTGFQERLKEQVGTSIELQKRQLDSDDKANPQISKRAKYIEYCQGQSTIFNLSALGPSLLLSDLQSESDEQDYLEDKQQEYKEMSLFGFGRNSKTYRPKKLIPGAGKGAAMHRYIQNTIGSGNMLEAVLLPPGENINEWLAVNTVEFYNAVCLMYGTLEEYCTPQQCERMTAGSKYEYLWADGTTVKKPIKLCAPAYMAHLFQWIESQLDDPSVFPSSFDDPFPENFKDRIHTIFKRLFRVYAHIYHHHWQQIVALEENDHLYTCFKHFIMFGVHFQVLESKELAPLQDAVDNVLKKVPQIKIKK